MTLELDARGCCYVFDGPEEILSIEPVSTEHTRARHFAATISAVPKRGAWAQFGVYRGNTARAYLLPALPERSTLELYDSFEGLPTDWQKGMSVEPAGKYACEPPRFDDSRVELVPGLFADTLPRAGDAYALIDIDCDLYESTLDVLLGCEDRIVPGTVIRFDEVFSYPNWREGEYRAIQEWSNQCNRRIQWLSRGAIYWATCRVTQ